MCFLVNFIFLLIREAKEIANESESWTQKKKGRGRRTRSPVSSNSFNALSLCESTFTERREEEERGDRPKTKCSGCYVTTQPKKTRKEETKTTEHFGLTGLGHIGLMIIIGDTQKMKYKTETIISLLPSVQHSCQTPRCSRRKCPWTRASTGDRGDGCPLPLLSRQDIILKEMLLTSYHGPAGVLHVSQHI